jgi:hypothetical protein
METGKKLENALGTTNLSVLLLSLGGVTNLVHITVCFLLRILFQDPKFLLIPCVGIWNLILAVIAMECAPAKPGSTKRMFVVEVPTRYYPCALLALFTLFSGGIEMSLCISVCVGYLFGFGKFDILKLKVEHRQRLEAGVLRKFTGMVGFVPGPVGNEWDLASYSNTQSAQEGQQGWTPTVFRRPDTNTNTNTEGTLVSKFEGGGNKLGTSSSSARSRPNATQPILDPSAKSRADRSVMLAAAERRANSQNDGDEEKGEK